MAPKKGKPSAPKAAEIPNTVTDKRGKEVSTTAAAGRPRRVSAPIATQTAPKSVTKTTAAATTPKKRGRPSKLVQDEPPKKRSRGANVKASAVEKDDTEEESEDAQEEISLPKKRGRPAKATSSKPAPAVTVEEKAPPRKRGRPPKGGETTKISTDARAAADQLEDELLDTMEELEEEKTATARKAKGGKAKPAPVKKTNKATEEDVAVESDAEGASSGKQYWLMKAEQEDRLETLKSGRQFNTKFTIDDLRSKTVPEPWDGVRNAMAAKNMRTMKKGDLAFFYASGGKAGRTPGITGIVEIVKEHEPDVTVSDEDSYGYVEKESDRAKWCVVHVEFRKKLTAPVSLKELQKYAQTNGVLAKMQVLTAARLSVAKVTEKEWDFIVDNLIQGYEDEEGQTQRAIVKETPHDDATKREIEVRVEIPITPTTTARNTARGKLTSISKKGKTDATLPAIVETTETSQPLVATTKDRTRASSRAAMGTTSASQPASHVTSQSLSQPVSRNSTNPTSATSSRPSTVNLAPTRRTTRSVSRGRSRTPRARTASTMTSVAEEDT